MGRCTCPGLRAPLQTHDPDCPAADNSLTPSGPPLVGAKGTIEVLDVDITTLDIEAITNAANTELKHLGGVAGAISRAAGPELERESRSLVEGRHGPLRLGGVARTTAGRLPSQHVIHAATMELGGPTSADIIRTATRNVLQLAVDHSIRTLALVAFGTGVGGFPLEQAAEIEAQEVAACMRSNPGAFDRIVFAVRGDDAAAAFKRAIEANAQP